MKILNVIEFWQLVNIHKGPAIEYLEYIGLITRATFDIRIIRAMDLYTAALSQPFEPEMITRLFEGWEIPDMGNGMRPVDVPKYNYYQSSDSSIGFPKVQIPHRQRFMGVEIGIGNDAKYYHFPEPKTLHDFIVNCQQAGIELTAKKGGWGEN